MADKCKQDPMHQFEIVPYHEVPFDLFGMPIYFTNSTLAMLVATGAATLLLTLAMSGRAMVPGRWQNVAELSYEFVADIVRSTTGQEGMRFFPLVFSIFMFVLFCNLVGMVPYMFTATSHIVVTFALALVSISAVLVIGFARNGLGFLRLFAPSGVPLLLMPLIIVIEVISFMTRPISLAVRLFANMLAGHTMLKVFAGFVVLIAVPLPPECGVEAATDAGFLSKLLAIVPLFASVAITGLEFLVAFLQAFIFAMLTSIYLNDALHPAH